VRSPSLSPAAMFSSTAILVKYATHGLRRADTMASRTPRATTANPRSSGRKYFQQSVRPIRAASVGLYQELLRRALRVNEKMKKEK